MKWLKELNDWLGFMSEFLTYVLCVLGGVLLVVYAVKYTKSETAIKIGITMIAIPLYSLFCRIPYKK